MEIVDWFYGATIAPVSVYIECAIHITRQETKRHMRSRSTDTTTQYGLFWLVSFSPTPLLPVWQPGLRMMKDDVGREHGLVCNA